MKHKIGNILLLAVVLMFVIIFNYICFDGAENVANLIKAKDNSVSLEATITSSESYTEIDEGIEREYWHANVTYTYDGITYSDVHYERTERRPEIGKVVTVKINPENPGELLPDVIETGLSLITAPVFLAGVTIALYFLAKLFAEWIASACRIQGGKFVEIIALLLVCGKMVIESIFFYKRHESLVFAMFSLIAAAALWFFVLRKKERPAEEPEKELA